MPRQMEPEKKARHQLIREFAKEQGEVIIANLAVDLEQAELWGSLRGMSPDQKVMFRKGEKQDCRSALGSPTMLNKLREWYAISRGPEAIWKRWITMTKRESSHVYQLLARHAFDCGYTARKDYESAHEERFSERLSSMSVSKKGNWDREDEQPIIERL